MGRFIIALVIIGGIVEYDGIKEFVLSEGASQEAIDMALADLENGKAPIDYQISLGAPVTI